jgi:hypothetical protein
MRRGMVRTALELDTRTVASVQTPLQEARQSTRIAQDIMNRRVRTVRPTLLIREAAQIMIEMGLHCLPVTEVDGTLLGMLTRADLLQVIVTSPLMSPHASSATQPLHLTSSHLSTPTQQQPVADYTNPNVATVAEQTPVADVIDALIISQLKRVIVVDHERKVKGIISDVDVLAGVQEDLRPRFLTMLTGWTRNKRPRQHTGSLHTQLGKATTAADIMNRDVITIAETTSVQDTIEQMIALHDKILPVVDAEGHLVGTIGRSDLLRVLLEG